MVSEPVKVRYDDHSVTVTPRFQEALLELMRAECEMMQGQEDAHPECWVWGRCHVADLSETGGLQFQFGDDDCLPEDDLGQFAVVFEPLTEAPDE